ncbi:MAG: nucleotidyltransferase domain-containing protein [Candidatus Odinarchaeota archaeon]
MVISSRVEMNHLFEPVMNVKTILSGFKHPWFIAGGWAIDLHLNRVTRAHDDVDIVVLKKYRKELQVFLLETVFRGSVRLAKASQGVFPKHPAHFDIFTLESDDDVCFLDKAKTIGLPLSMIGSCYAGGLPFLTPEIVVYFKARNTSSKDERDFSNIVNHFNASCRQWLKQVLQACYPDHPWLGKL